MLNSNNFEASVFSMSELDKDSAPIADRVFAVMTYHKPRLSISVLNIVAIIAALYNGDYLTAILFAALTVAVFSIAWLDYDKYILVKAIIGKEDCVVATKDAFYEIKHGLIFRSHRF